MLWQVRAQVCSGLLCMSTCRSRAALTYAEAQSRLDDPRLSDEVSTSQHPLVDAVSAFSLHTPGHCGGCHNLSGCQRLTCALMRKLGKLAAWLFEIRSTLNSFEWEVG